MQSTRALPPAARLPLFLYRLLFPVAFLFLLPGVLSRMLRRGNYRHQFGQRFGWYSAEARRRLADGAGEWTWIHAVSVGEMMMGLRLAQTLQSTDPGARLLISTTTSTGFAIARDRLLPGMELIYFPLDATSIVRRVLRLIRPRRIVLVDKELWPNLVTESYRRAIPLAIVNARLSPRSERGFRRWHRWVSPFFAMLDLVCVQEPEEIEQWHGLGVRREALHCTGALKYDFPETSSRREAEFRTLLQTIGIPPAAPILLGGSTFDGEEAALARLFLALRPRHPELLLILVPRHVERTAAIQTTLQSLGLRTLRRSELSQTPAAEPRPDILLVDTTGELRDWYAVATACFIGKSLCATGGQNPAEPILAGRPVLFGPHMENFSALVRQFLAVQGAIQVPDEAALEAALEPLLADPSAGAAMAARARAALAIHQGANARTIALLRQK